LQQLDLLELFDVICSGDHVAHGKPAPDIYLLAAKKIGLPPGYCLAVEDSPAGILSAYRAGCLPVFVPDQDEADETTQAMLYGRIDSLTDIMDILKEEQL
jgi:beta-phosphoglucomutase-like phosphatase (HAD superfamily)